MSKAPDAVIAAIFLSLFVANFIFVGADVVLFSCIIMVVNRVY